MAREGGERTMGIIRGARCDYSDCHERAQWRLGWLFAARPMCDKHANEAVQRDHRLMKKPLLEVVKPDNPSSAHNDRWRRANDDRCSERCDIS
jgi:hypothetical protein